MGLLDKILGREDKALCDYCGAPIKGKPVRNTTGLQFCDDQCRREFEGQETSLQDDKIG